MTLREHGIIHITRVPPDQETELERLQALWDRKSKRGQKKTESATIPPKKKKSRR